MYRQGLFVDRKRPCLPPFPVMHRVAMHIVRDQKNKYVPEPEAPSFLKFTPEIEHVAPSHRVCPTWLV